MIATVLFCMATVAYVLYTKQDTESAQTAVNMAFLIIGTTVSSYVFGAVWQDKRGQTDVTNNSVPGAGGCE